MGMTNTASEMKMDSDSPTCPKCHRRNAMIADFSGEQSTEKCRDCGHVRPYDTGVTEDKIVGRVMVLMGAVRYPWPGEVARAFGFDDVVAWGKHQVAGDFVSRTVAQLRD